MLRTPPGLLLIAACLAALALRVLVPAGWMPVAGNDGMVLALCSGNAIPVDTGDPLLPETDETLCGYMIAAGPLLLAATLLLPLLTLPALPLLAPVPALATARRHRPRPPGQGPPRA